MVKWHGQKHPEDTNSRHLWLIDYGELIIFCFCFLVCFSLSIFLVLIILFFVQSLTQFLEKKIKSGENVADPRLFYYRVKRKAKFTL